ncbi:MAG: hypothetical protein ACOC6F_00745, partial [bacterium]
MDLAEIAGKLSRLHPGVREQQSLASVVRRLTVDRPYLHAVRVFDYHRQRSRPFRPQGLDNLSA